MTADLQPATHHMRDGAHLALYGWPLPAVQRRASVLLVHGLGEHMGRYTALAQRLNAWGLAVHGYDHYGHGRSDGPRGGLRRSGQLLDHLQEMLELTRGQLAPDEPLVLLGHSMGGLVAAAQVARQPDAVQALVLSAPALAIRANALQRLLLAVLPRLAPGLRVSNGLDPDALTHDHAIVAAYRADPLCHDRISARLAHFLASAGQQQVLARAAQWRTPTLLLWGEDDTLIDPAGCRRFAAAAPPAVVTARGFAGLYHEIFNELACAPVFAALQQWLERLPGGPAQA